MLSTYTACHFVIQHRATSTHNNTNYRMLLSPYTKPIIMQLSTVQPALKTTPPPFGWCHRTHNISPRNSAQCNQHTQHHQLQMDGVTLHRAYNSQLSTVYPAHITPPLPFGWCHHTHSVSTRNSIQSTQLTQHHHFPLDLVTISRAYQLATQYSAPSTHNNTTSI